MKNDIKTDIKLIVPTVAQLRANGWKVKCLYFRLESGIHYQKSIKEIRKDYRHYLQEERKIAGCYRACKGGKTIIDLVHKDGRRGLGASICSPEDFFVRKIGRELAIKRALENVKD